MMEPRDRADVVEKWNVEESDHDCRQRGVAHTNTPPVKWQQYNRQEFHRNRQPKREGCDRPPSARQRGDGYDQEQRANNINVTAARHLNRQQWIPCVRQNQVRAPSAGSQEIKHSESNPEIANHERHFHGSDRLMNRGYGAEE